MQRRSETKQHTLWLLAALFAPIAHFGGCGWFAAVLAALVVLPVTAIAPDWGNLSRPHALIQLLWLGAAAGTLLRESGAYWPSTGARVVPLVLLVLAALTAHPSAPRIGAVLCFCQLLLLIPLTVTAAAKFEPDWMVPQINRWPMGLMLALLLPMLPASADAGRARQALSVGAMTVGITALLQGVLSAAVASEISAPLYEAGRTLGRLEPIAAVTMTLSWYALSTYLLRSGSVIAEEGGWSGKMATVLLLGTATLFVLFPQQLKQQSLTLLSSFLWVLIPVLRKIIHFKKSEKSA